MANRILIVEDEGIVALDIQNRLEAHGFEVIDIVSTGSRAVESAMAEYPDLILMDINLKGSIDGIETASLIKRHIDCPIIFLTAFADEKTLKKARISDASGYILKPFREGELLITIDLAIKRALVKKKIQENSHWLYNTLNNIHDAVITVSDENLIIFINDQAKKILNESLNVGEEFNSESFISVEGERTFFINGENKTDIEYFQTEIHDENGEPLGVVHFIHDITKQVEYEIGLEKARLAAEKSYRSKNDFLANVTHELRTPLNTIIGMNSLISENSEDDEILIMHDLINKAAGSLLNQLNDILELSEIESGKSKIYNNRFSIAELIDNCIETFRAQIELKSLKIIIESESEIPLIIGDKNKIKEIISSLLSNSVKFTRKGLIKVISSLSEDQLIISIEDSGIGLSEDQKNTIFELFTQVDGSHTRMYGGTGLGLTLVNNLVVFMKGSINVESGKSLGSKFTFSLPVKISGDQKSDIEENVTPAKKSIRLDTGRNSSGFSDLLTLLEKIKELLSNNKYDSIEKEIKSFSLNHKISELNYESQVLFRISIALKLKNKEKINRIIDEVSNEPVNSTGGVYENSNS